MFRKAMRGAAVPLDEFDAKRESQLSYASAYRSLLYRLNCLVIALLIMSLGANVYLAMTYRPVRVLHLTEDMRVLPTPPLSEPSVSDAAIMTWFMQTVSDTFSFTYGNWKDVFAAQRSRFTPSSFEAVLDGFMRHIELAAEQRMVVETVFIRVPTILKEDIVKGVYQWTVGGIAEIRFENLKDAFSQVVNVKAVIERVNGNGTIEGLQIKSIVFSPHKHN